jgi:hypothetical protein
VSGKQGANKREQNGAEIRGRNTITLGGADKDQRTESREQRAENRKHKAESS